VNIILLAIVLFLVVLSAFFSGSETGMMALNRYRLRHLAKKSPAAKRAETLLKRPDRLLGVILIGNTVSNILASSLATILASRWFGDFGIAMTTIVLTLFILLFSEVLPKTLAAIQPECFAFPATIPLKFLHTVLYPLVFILNAIVNNILRLFGVNVKDRKMMDPLTSEELRSVVRASGQSLNGSHKNMLLGVLDLEHATVQDAMIPRQNMVGVDLNDPWPDILKQLKASSFSKLPVYRDSIDHVLGILHVKKLIHLPEDCENPVAKLEALLEPPYFIPETSSLQQQLFRFQQHSRHLALVVDEYGDIQGLVTVQDILEEIVGEFTDFSQPSAHLHTRKMKDGSTLVDASMTVRDLNRDLNLRLPTDGPKTLSGLIVEYLEAIPTPKTSIKIRGYPIEILSVQGNAVRKAKIYARIDSSHLHEE
jgi:Mg2+/Co2+ transporter CorB